MAFRNDVYIDWELSPRLIWIAAPSTDISVQDLHDTLVAIQDSITGSEFPDLINSAGKEALGGVTQVGITTTLQNAQIAFEARFLNLTTGTVTTQDTNGVTLIAAAETYITDNVIRGSVAHNHLDGSHATVLTIDSETQLTTTQLEGGVDNNYDIGDTIIISKVIQMNISGGNVVAVDDVGDELDPVFPTYGTQVVRTSSSSATLQNQSNIDNIKYLIETTRPHHTGLGDVWYWNPDSGDDSFTGSSASQAFKTFAAAHDAAGDGSHDVIVALSGVSGETITEETIEITKNYLLLRGPGRDFRFKPTSTIAPTISINAIGVEVSGVVVDTAGSGGQSAISVQDGGDFFFIDHCWSRDAQHAAVEVLGSTVYGRIDGCFFSHAIDYGIHVNGNTRHLKITNTELDSSSGNGIYLEGTTVRNNIIGQGVKIYNSGGYGIQIDSPGTRNHIDSDVSIYDNALGSILDNGVLTDNENIVEGTITMKQAIRAILAASAGKLSGAAGTTITIRDTDDSTDRIVATVDANGNRTAVTLDLD